MPDVLFAEVARRFPGADPANNPQPETVAEFFAGTRVDMTTDDAMRLASDWDPDLIIAEATDFVGPLVASSLNVPWSVLAFGPAVPDEFVAPMREVALSRYAQRGLPPTAPVNYIDPSPLSLQPAGWVAPANRLPFRAEAHRRSGVERWSPSPRTHRKKSVLVTLGTVFTDIGVVEMILDSIDVDRYEVVATLGVVPGLSRPSGEGVEFVGFVPLSELLNDVDVVVNSGGAGTVLASLSRGLPMVVFPQGADQFINAQRSVESGSALVVRYPSAVGAAIDTVVDDGRFAAAARATAEEMSTAPSPSDVIAELERQHLGGLTSNGL
jgi:UDP:flavonoid glycosyltransferase YjiC (YdhE family)